MSLIKRIIKNIQEHEYVEESKLSIIGANVIGIAAAVSILNKRITKNLVLVDPFDDKVNGEILDLQHAAVLLGNPKISGGNHLEATKGSKLCIITASVQIIPGESRLSLTQRNADILVKLIPELVKYSPNTLLLVVGEPCNVMSYVAWKASGFASSKVIGIGTTLDSARFSFNLSQKFNICPRNVHAWIIGKHGDHSIPIWQRINIANNRLQKIDEVFDNPDHVEEWIQCYKDVMTSAQKIQEMKGHVCWGVGIAVAAITSSILSNKLSVFPVSVNAKGTYGINEDVYVPLPSVLGINGVTDIIDIHLDESNLLSLQSISKIMKEIQDGVNLGTHAHKCNCTKCKKR